MQSYPLMLSINNIYGINVGICRVDTDEQLHPYRVILPPQTSMYQQIITLLEETSKDQKVLPKSQLHFGEIALATSLVCIRWGSYFGALVNADLPQWTFAHDPEVGCISDSEMARINIEVTAALATWLNTMHEDPSYFRKMVKAAIQFLPAITQIPDSNTQYKHFHAMSFFNSTKGRQTLMDAYIHDFGEAWVAREKSRIAQDPTRALANGMFNKLWRNGEIENIHAGSRDSPLPLLQRRLTLQQEMTLMRDVTESLVPFMRSLYNMATKPAEDDWLERVLIHALSWYSPENWTLTEKTRGVWLADNEPPIS